MSLFLLIQVSFERGETKLWEFGNSIPELCTNIITFNLFSLEPFDKIYMSWVRWRGFPLLCYASHFNHEK
jgi:hypothetical protein